MPTAKSEPAACTKVQNQKPADGQTPGPGLESNELTHETWPDHRRTVFDFKSWPEVLNALR